MIYVLLSCLPLLIVSMMLWLIGKSFEDDGLSEQSGACEGDDRYQSRDVWWA